MSKVTTEFINQKRVSIIRNYPLETLVVAMGMAIGVVFYQQRETDKKVDVLQNEMKAYLRTDRDALIQTVEKNTEAMESVKIYLKERK